MYYKARYYHPALGRFISADTLVPRPSDPQSLNRYSYVQNNPLKYTDSSGHAAAPGGMVDGTWEDLFRAYNRVAGEVDPEAYRGFLTGLEFGGEECNRKNFSKYASRSLIS